MFFCILMSGDIHLSMTTCDLNQSRLWLLMNSASVFFFIARVVLKKIKWWRFRIFQLNSMIKMSARAKMLLMQLLFGLFLSFWVEFVFAVYYILPLNIEKPRQGKELEFSCLVCACSVTQLSLSCVFVTECLFCLTCQIERMRSASLQCSLTTTTYVVDNCRWGCIKVYLSHQVLSSIKRIAFPLLQILILQIHKKKNPISPNNIEISLGFIYDSQLNGFLCGNLMLL